MVIHFPLLESSTKESKLGKKFQTDQNVCSARPLNFRQCLQNKIGTRAVLVLQSTVVFYQNESFSSKWELSFWPPSSLELWRNERARRAALILMKNSQFDRTLWYFFCENCNFSLKCPARLQVKVACEVIHLPCWKVWQTVGRGSFCIIYSGKDMNEFKGRLVLEQRFAS